MVRDAISLNQSLYERPQDILTAARSTSRAASAQFTIEGYRILRKIGAGGMAEIYLVATDKPDELQVLKVMRMGTAGRATPCSASCRNSPCSRRSSIPMSPRFTARTSPRLRYIAMEYLSHGDLRARIAEGVKRGRCDLVCAPDGGCAWRDPRGRHRAPRPQARQSHAAQDGSLALADFGVAKHVAILITRPRTTRWSARLLSEPGAGNGSAGRPALRPVQPGDRVL